MFNEWVSITCLYYKEKLLNNLSNQQKEKNLFFMHADKGVVGGGKYNKKGRWKSLAVKQFPLLILLWSW